MTHHMLVPALVGLVVGAACAAPRTAEFSDAAVPTDAPALSRCPDHAGFDAEGTVWRYQTPDDWADLVGARRDTSRTLTEMREQEDGSLLVVLHEATVVTRPGEPTEMERQERHYRCDTAGVWEVYTREEAHDGTWKETVWHRPRPIMDADPAAGDHLVGVAQATITESDGREREQDRDYDIEALDLGPTSTPAGTFRGLTFRWLSGRFYNDRYFAPDVGFVRDSARELAGYE